MAGLKALTTEAMCRQLQAATLEQQGLTATGLGGSLYRQTAGGAF